MNEKPLKKWWWRNLGKPSQLWSKGFRTRLANKFHRREVLRVAWFYEVDQRLNVDRSYRFGKPFPKLSEREIQKAIDVWGRARVDEKKRAYALSFPSPNQTPTNWEHWWGPRLSVNLEVSDEAIFRALQNCLLEERKKRGIKPSKKGARKGISPRVEEAWKQIECLDRPIPGDDSSRKLQSEARRKYSELCKSQLPE